MSRNRKAAEKYQLRIQLEYPAHKTCGDCGREFPNTSEFFRRTTFKYHAKGRCLKCEVVRARELTTRRKYGISFSEYQTMFVDAWCKICGSRERLVLDHCHKTNRKRGVLCSDCNTALGMMHDDSNLFRRAAEYLDGEA